MPIAYRHEPEIDAIALTVSGVVTWPERKIMVRVAEFLRADLNIKRILLDCSRLSRDGNVDDAFAFAKQLNSKLSIFKGMRIAVLPARDFFCIPSVAVLAMQDAGISIIECQSEAEARAWLAEEGDADEDGTENAA